MIFIRPTLFLVLFAYAALASPIDPIYHVRLAREESILYPRQDQSALSGPVTFQTVTTSQTDAGLITTTCTVTLSPITAADGSTQVQEDKQCKIQVGTDALASSPLSSNGSGDTSTTAPSSTDTAVPSQGTETISSSSVLATATNVPAISEIGVGTIPASATGTASPSPSASASSGAASASAPPAISVIGPGQIPASDTGTVLPASNASGTTPIAAATSLSNGQLSTSTTTPSAEQAAATTPGQKLEVLPIGLGVFAGVSVIALIVVGLVTYERTKYRKAYRQRKLAEAGANMGYGGMAERT